MTGRDPNAVGSLIERLRNIGESDLCRAREFGGRLMWELTDRATLAGRVLLVTENLGGGGTGHRHRQDADPGAPAGAAACEPQVQGSSVGHPVPRLAEIARWDKAARRSGNAAWRPSARTGVLDSGALFHLQ